MLRDIDHFHGWQIMVASYIDDYWFLISLFGAANFSFMKVTTFVTILPVCATSAGVVCRYHHRDYWKAILEKKAELLIRSHWLELKCSIKRCNFLNIEGNPSLNRINPFLCYKRGRLLLPRHKNSAVEQIGHLPNGTVSNV